MNKYRVIIICCCAVFAFASCKKDNVDYKYPQPFDGQTIQLPGIAGNEEGYYAANSVFVDFSRGVVSTARRDSWNLGLYPGPDFKVIINHSMGAMVVEVPGKTDIAAVNASDSSAIVASLGGTLNFKSPESVKRIDPVAPDSAADYLSKLTHVEVGENEQNSKVYIVSSGMAGTTRNRIPPTTIPPGTEPDKSLLQFPWYKFQVYKGTNGYIVKYGLLNAKAFSPVFVSKNISFNFNYLSFSARSVIAEPAKSLWDIEWTWTTYQDANGKPDSTSNFVLINFLGGVTAAQLTITQARTYENFTDANLKDQDIVYSGKRDAIGTKWRTISEGIDKDGNKVQVSTFNRNLFYLVRDGEGNVYKLRFKSSSNNDGGANGRPAIEYRLVQAVTNPSL